jgi:hypothetical protein
MYYNYSSILVVNWSFIMSFLFPERLHYCYVYFLSSHLYRYYKLLINFGGKLSFILSFLFPGRLHYCYVYFLSSHLYMYYNYSSILVVNWVSSCLSFSLNAFTIATDISSPPTCTGTAITLESCAWNAESQHFIPGFSKISLLCGYHWKEGLGDERRGSIFFKVLLEGPG